MDKYIRILKQIQDNKWSKRYASTLASIEKYILGEITPNELLNEVPDSEKSIIFRVINKILNYKERDVRYYVQLPKDLFFGTKGKKCILVGKTKALNIDYDELTTIGPKVVQDTSLEFIDKNYIEITGNFSNYPEGVVLFESDWYKIISKYPKIHELMYKLTEDDFELNYVFENITREESDRRVDEEISYKENLPLNMDINEEATHLTQQTIDSIEFIIPKNYLKLSEIKNGNLRTFKQIVKSKEEGYINISLDDLVNYFYNNGITHTKFSVGLELDLSFLTETTLSLRSKEEKVILLAAFLLKYKGVDADSHLYWFKNDKDVINARICDIPLIEFAKLNNEELAQIFADIGVEETIQPENKNYIIEIAKQLGYEEDEPRRENDSKALLTKK